MVLSLALSIGASTASLTLINALMLRPLPVYQPEQLVELLHRYPGEPRLNGFSWESYQHFRSNNHVFSTIIGFAPASFSTRLSGDTADPLHGEYVTTDYFTMLGIAPALGRFIAPTDRASDSAIAVVSWSLWDRAFQRNPAILGRRITVENVPVTIVGVAPRRFAGLESWTQPDLWLPVELESVIRPGRATADRTTLILAARLKPGIRITQARAEMAVLFRFTLDE